MIRGLENMTFKKKLWERNFFSLRKRLKTSLITVFIHQMGDYTPNRPRVFSLMQSEKIRGIQLQYQIFQFYIYHLIFFFCDRPNVLVLILGDIWNSTGHNPEVSIRYWTFRLDHASILVIFFVICYSVIIS